ncbi:hypothetical protein D9M70_594200 [compost metagenome]
MDVSPPELNTMLTWSTAKPCARRAFTISLWSSRNCRNASPVSTFSLTCNSSSLSLSVAVTRPSSIGWSWIFSVFSVLPAWVQAPGWLSAALGCNGLAPTSPAIASATALVFGFTEMPR